MARRLIYTSHLAPRFLGSTDKDGGRITDIPPPLTASPRPAPSATDLEAIVHRVPACLTYLTAASQGIADWTLAGLESSGIPQCLGRRHRCEASLAGFESFIVPVFFFLFLVLCSYVCI